MFLNSHLNSLRWIHRSAKIEYIVPPPQEGLEQKRMISEKMFQTSQFYRKGAQKTFRVDKTYKAELKQLTSLLKISSGTKIFVENDCDKGAWPND